jgi:hypothetical protein
LATAAALLLGAGCGDDDNTTSEDRDGAGAAAAQNAAGDSAYCDVAVDWAIYEMQPFDEMDPVQFEAYWADHTAFEEAAVAAVPDVLAEDWQLKVATEDETIDVVLETYGYDIGRIMEEGTPEEQATFEAPPDVAAAQDRIIAYESEVCGSAQPRAADVSYDGEEPGPYCDLILAQNEMGAQALASGDPAEVEAVFDELEAQSAETIEAAPAVIHDDVADIAAWIAGPKRDVAEAYGFDIVAAMQDGTAQERLDLNDAAAEIREQFARVAAYEAQVCGA